MAFQTKQIISCTFLKEFIHVDCAWMSMKSKGLPSEGDLSVTPSHLPLPTSPAVS